MAKVEFEWTKIHTFVSLCVLIGGTVFGVVNTFAYKSDVKDLVTKQEDFQEIQVAMQSTLQLLNEKLSQEVAARKSAQETLKAEKIKEMKAQLIKLERNKKLYESLLEKYPKDESIQLQLDTIELEISQLKIDLGIHY